MPKIYGVNTIWRVNPKNVRDAMVRCFAQVHKEVMLDCQKMEKIFKPQEVEEIKQLNIKHMICALFEEVGGDFNNPDKKSILLVLKKLKGVAKNFRSPEIVNRHYCEIKTLVERLQDI